MALGRTRMCGRVEESILRRSRGSKPYCCKEPQGQPKSLPQFASLIGSIQTFAINSNFRNSPLTSVTFPFMSNSVHRIRNSFDALAARPRPMLKIPSFPSSISAGPWFPVLLVSAALLRLRSKSRRRNGRDFVEAWRVEVIDPEVVGSRTGFVRA